MVKLNHSWAEMLFSTWLFNIGSGGLDFNPNQRHLRHILWITWNYSRCV